MEKKTSKSKKSKTVTKPKDSDMMIFDFDGKNWNNKGAMTPEKLSEVLERLVADRKSTPPSTLPFLPTARITVVVAETLIYTKDNGEQAKYKMETGRQMAQVAHAVSGLKLSYIAEHSKKRPDQTLELVKQLQNTGITTIVLKARDNKEIDHLRALAEEKNLLHFVFNDDNQGVYGTRDSIQTAIAIGPLSASYEFEGITDYLPLWQDPT